MVRTKTPVRLEQSDTELRSAFEKLATRAQVAALLGSTDTELIYLLYRGGSQYIEFDVPKRNGQMRHIAAPSSSIKILQKRLNQILQAVYRPKAPVQGFTRNRSIVSNADHHINKRVVLNIDLEDFFPTIHFGRVRGVFVKPPYNLPVRVAEVLAQICCHNRCLPQGAPTSPIVSNMVCASLDSGLRKIAEKYACTYTRYADDITFSTTRKALPAALVRVVAEPGQRRRFLLGQELVEVILTNSFRINAAKVRVRGLGERRDVTGLIVHQGVNVPREYVRSVRGMLHAWERYGHDRAEAELRARHHRKHRRPGSPEVKLRDVAAGKIEFIRMVRGSSDVLHTRLWNRFAKVAGQPFTQRVAIIQDRKFLDSALWVLESETETGTAFALEGHGLVSCAHCVDKGPVVAYQPGEITKTYLVTVTHRCEHRDIVKVKIDAPIDAALKSGDSKSVKAGDATVAAGFGNYAPGASSRLIAGAITGKGVRHGINVFFSDHRAFGGNSGGPVLNAQNAVIGILQRAVTKDSPGQETTILPIELLIDVPPVKDEQPKAVTTDGNTAPA
jgi:RNA-directed DNA polymerase